MSNERKDGEKKVTAPSCFQFRLLATRSFPDWIFTKRDTCLPFCTVSLGLFSIHPFVMTFFYYNVRTFFWLQVFQEYLCNFTAKATEKVLHSIWTLNWRKQKTVMTKLHETFNIPFYLYCIFFSTYDDFSVAELVEATQLKRNRPRQHVRNAMSQY